MSAPTANAKASLREQVRARLKDLPVAERDSASTQLRTRLAGAKWFVDAPVILFFAPLPDEPDVWPLLETVMACGKVIALPRFSSAAEGYRAAEIRNLATDVIPGQFGAREPAAHCPEVPLNRLDLTLVPGVAFDARGARLGRGKGFFDRLLALVRGRTCGVAFEEQLVEAVPLEPHDIRLHCILTPLRLIET